MKMADYSDNGSDDFKHGKTTDRTDGLGKQ